MHYSRQNNMKYFSNHFEVDYCNVDKQEKDLRISYLEQYQTQRYLGNDNSYGKVHEKSHPKISRDTLKDITDKYGYTWTQEGKLSKKDLFKDQIKTEKVWKETEVRQKHAELDQRIDQIYSKYRSQNKMKTENQQQLPIKVPSFGTEGRKFKTVQKRSRSVKERKQKINLGEVNEKINEINLKIKQSEKKKKYLDINYQPFRTAEKKNTRQTRNIEVKGKRQKTNVTKEDENVQTFSLGEKLQTKTELTEEKITFIEGLRRQISFDERFRNYKIRFEKNQDPHKWGYLADILLKQGKKVKYHELYEIFGSQTQEYNPFLQTEGDQNEYEPLIEAYHKAQNFWENCIKNRIEQEDFLRENFTVSELDIEGKGRITIESLVRYMNMRTGEFFRNRDLSCIFRRVAGKNKRETHYSQFLKVLSK